MSLRLKPTATYHSKLRGRVTPPLSKTNHMHVYVSHKIDEEPIHWEYTIEKGDRTTAINQKDGEYLAGILDSGDDITIEIAGQELVLDYHEAEYLTALLLAQYEGRLELKEVKTYRSI